MTSKFNPSVHNGLWNIRNNAKFSIISLLLHLAGAPAILISTMINILKKANSIPLEEVILIALGATFFAGALGILYAFFNFKYLYTKNQVDMSLSAPLSMKQRFLSDYISGLVSYIVPFLAAQVFSIILLIIGLTAFDGHEFEIIRDYGGDRIWTETYTCSVFGEILPIYGRLFLGGILLMVMLYTLTVLVITCCGTAFDSVLMTFFINAAIPMFIYQLADQTLGRIMVDFTKPLMNLMAWTSPAGGFATLLSGCLSADYADYNVPMAVWTIGVIIISAAFLAGAYLLYKKRRAEQVSTPIVFRGIYAVTVTLILFIAEQLMVGSDFSSVMGDNAKSGFGVLAASFAVYLLAEIVSNRSLKKLWKGAVRYAVTLGVFLGCIGIINSTAFFGVEYKVPDADKVEKVYLAYGGVYREFPSYSFTVYNEDSDQSGIYVIEDRENIENIVNAHSETVNLIKQVRQQQLEPYWALNGSWDYIFETTDIPVSTSEYSICYEMKNGSRLTRSYPVMTAEALRCFMKIETSEEYKAQAAEKIKATFDPFEEIVESRELYDALTDDPNVKTVRLDVINTELNSIFAYQDNSFKNETVLDAQLYGKIRDALAKDIADRTPEEYFTPCTNRRYELWISGVIVQPIDGSFDETMKVLAENGCLDGIDGDIEQLFDEENFRGNENQRLYININKNRCENNASRVLYCEENGISGNEYTKIYWENTQTGKAVIHYSDELAQLIGVMQKKYVSAEPCYTLIFNGDVYVIPPEYSDLAEKVYLSAEDIPEDGEALYYGMDL